jgi:DNA-binding NarL/FixJ family response regulator
MNPITVVSIDDHHLIHEAIRSLLSAQDDIEIVGQGHTGEDLFPLMEVHQPDVLLLDLHMPQSNKNGNVEMFAPIPAFTTLRQEYEETAVIILSQHHNLAMIQAAVENGVKGYLLKGDNLSLKLAGAIDAASKGGVYFSQEISQQLFNPLETTNQAVTLTDRQRECIQVIAQNPDLPYQQLAQQLGITEHTFKWHLTNAFKQLCVTNITACIIRCMQLKLISFTLDEQGGISFKSNECSARQNL